jgi:hypothetical protein
MYIRLELEFAVKAELCCARVPDGTIDVNLDTVGHYPNGIA